MLWSQGGIEFIKIKAFSIYIVTYLHTFISMHSFMKSLFCCLLLLASLIPFSLSAQYGVLGPDISHCLTPTGSPPDVVTLNATTAGATAYSWSTNATTASIAVFSNTVQIKTYIVKITSGTTFIYDTIKVEFMSLPQPPTVTSPITTCAGSVSLAATTAPGSTALWYTSNTAPNPIGAGSPYIYDAQSNTTMYVAAVNKSSFTAYVGEKTSGSLQGTITSSSQLGERFRAYKPFTLESVKVYPSIGGTVAIELRDSLDNKLDAYSQPVSANILQEINVNFNVLPSNRYYKLVVTFSSAGTLSYKTGTSAFYPYKLGDIMSIISNSNGSTASYYYLYDWKIKSFGCIGAKVPITINVLPTPHLTLTDTIACTSAITLNMGNQGTGASYKWQKVGGTSILGTNATQVINSPSASYFAYSEITTGNKTCSDQDTIMAIFSTTPATLPSASNVTVCQGNVSIPATGSSGSRLLWWSSATPTNTNYLGTGSPLSYNATSTSTIYVNAYNVATVRQTVGENAVVPLTVSTSNIGTGLKFDMLKPMILDSVHIYPLKTGDMTIQVLSSTGAIIAQSIQTVTVAYQYERKQIYLGFVLPPGTGYRLVMQFNTIGGFKGHHQSSFPKQVPSFIKITGNTGVASAKYYPVFYNWKLRALTCPTAMKPVVVTVNAAPKKTMVQDTFACAPIMLNAGNWGLGTTYSFTEIPSNVSYGGGLNDSISNVIGNGSHKIKITGAMGTCSATDTVNVDVFANAIAVPTTSPITSCGGNIALTANAGTNQVVWWDALTGGNVIGSGSPFAYSIAGSSSAQTNTTVYAQSYATSQYIQSIGEKIPDGVLTAANGSGLVFSVSAGKAVFIDQVSVFYYGATAASVKVELQNASGVVIATKTHTIPSASLNAQVIPLTFFVYEGNNYRLVIKAPNLQLGQRAANLQFPYSSNGNIQITSSINSLGTLVSNRYYSLFDWKVRVLPCKSANRTPLAITILKSPTLDLGVNVASCAAQQCFNAQNTGATFQWYKDALLAANLQTSTSSVFCASAANFTGNHRLICVASVANAGSTTCKDTFNVGVNLMPTTASVTAPNIQQCGGAVNFTATSTNADQIVWWTLTTPPAVVGYGSPYTANINGTTTYNAIAYQVTDAFFDLGIKQPGGGQTNGNVVNSGTRFTVGYNNTTVGGIYIDSVTIYTNGTQSGSVVISMYNATTGALEATKQWNTVAQIPGSSSLLPTQVPIKFFAKKGDHILKITSLSSSAGLGVYETVLSSFYTATNPLLILKENGGTPTHIYISSGITSTGVLSNTLYQFFDWKVRMLPVNNGCPSAADPAVATILPTPNESQLPSDTVLCTSGTGANCVTLSMVTASSTHTWSYDPLPLGGTNPANTYAINSNSICVPTQVTAKSTIQTCSDIRTINVDITPSPPAPILKDTTVCPGYVQLVANSGNADYIAWYNAPQNGSQIGGGDTLNYFVVGGNQTIYAQSYNIGHFGTDTGWPTWSGNTATLSGNTEVGLLFDVYKPTIIDSVSLFLAQPLPTTGTIRIEVVRKEIDANGVETVSTIYFKNWSDWSNILTSGTKKYIRVPLNFFITPNVAGVSYVLKLADNTNINTIKLGYDTGTGPYFPIQVQGALSINASLVGATVVPTSYYYFYDWSIRTAKCASAMADMNLTLSNVPTHFVSVGTDFITCGDTTVVLGPGPYPAGYTYAWLAPYNNTPLATTSSYNVTNTGTYIGVVYNSLIEGHCGVYDTANYTINPAPVAFASYAPTFGPPCDIDFNNAGSSFGTYSWNFGHPSSGVANTSTAPTPSHTYTAKGTYTVTLTTTNDCGSNSVTIGVDCYGVEIEDDIFGSLNIFPNPAVDVLNVEFKHTAAPSISLKLLNSLGQVLQTKNADINGGTGIETFNLTNIPAGIYYLNLESKGKISTQKIVIQK